MKNLKTFSSAIAMLITFLSFGQGKQMPEAAKAERTITGTVTDQQSLPLPGVSIVVKGSSRGTQTDFDGKYKIQAATGETLIFNYIGYAEQKIKLSSVSVVNVILTEESTALEEVVVNMGYKSTTAKRQTSASVSSSSSKNTRVKPRRASIQETEEKTNAPIRNTQGHLAGMNIATGSGQPGADSTIILRGRRCSG
jgi:hypothetical protein